MSEKCVKIKSVFILVPFLRDDEEVQGKKWGELTQYFGANDRFQPPACSRPSAKVLLFFFQLFFFFFFCIHPGTFFSNLTYSKRSLFLFFSFLQMFRFYLLPFTSFS